MVRYAGVFSNAHHLRGAVAPAAARRAGQTEPAQTRLLTFSGRAVDTKNAGPATPSKIAWAQLLARVFQFDVLTCPRVGCGGKLKATAAVLQSREIALLNAMVSAAGRFPVRRSRTCAGARTFAGGAMKVHSRLQTDQPGPLRPRSAGLEQLRAKILASRASELLPNQ